MIKTVKLLGWIMYLIVDYLNHLELDHWKTQKKNMSNY